MAEVNKNNILHEFVRFIEEHKVGGLAIAFIMGFASTTLVKSLVENIIMPTVTPFIPGGAWKSATLAIGPIVLGIGAFTGELLNFLVIAIVVFAVAKFAMKEKRATKKKQG